MNQKSKYNVKICGRTERILHNAAVLRSLLDSPSGSHVEGNMDALLGDYTIKEQCVVCTFFGGEGVNPV